MKLLFILFIVVQSLTASAFEWDEGSDQTKALRESSGLKILWWNVHGARGGRYQEEPVAALSNNLSELIHSNLAPDIMAFAEYGDASLSAKALAEINLFYPYNEHWAYPQFQNYGLVLYSRYPFQVADLQELDFTPPNTMNEVELKKYRKTWCDSGAMCKRNFVAVNVLVGNRVIQFIPIHLYDVWRKFKKLNGSVKTVQEILLGDQNPLGFQLERFLQMLSPKLNLPTIVVGDFNIPKKLMVREPRMYRKLKRELNDIVDGQDSFPAKTSEERGHFPKMQIDHAFTAGGLKDARGRVLQLKGSDHYPIYVIVKP